VQGNYLNINFTRQLLPAAPMTSVNLRCGHPYFITLTVVLQLEGLTPLILQPCIVQILKHFLLHKSTFSNCKLIFKIPSRYSLSAISVRLLEVFIINFIWTCNISQVTKFLVVLINSSVVTNYEDAEFLPVLYFRN